jgi:hypothetical protein
VPPRSAVAVTNDAVTAPHTSPHPLPAMVPPPRPVDEIDHHFALIERESRGDCSDRDQAPSPRDSSPGHARTSRDARDSRRAAHRVDAEPDLGEGRLLESNRRDGRDGWVRVGAVRAWSRDGEAAARELLRRAVEAERDRALHPAVRRPPPPTLWRGRRG